MIAVVDLVILRSEVAGFVVVDNRPQLPATSTPVLQEPETGALPR